MKKYRIEVFASDEDYKEAVTSLIFENAVDMNCSDGVLAFFHTGSIVFLSMSKYAVVECTETSR